MSEDARTRPVSEGEGRDRRILVGIAGGTASGKSLVANRIMESLGERLVTIVRQDHYYRDLSSIPFEERARVNFDHPGAFDSGLLREHVLRLLRGEGIDGPKYDYARHVRLPETAPVGPTRVIVLEGLLVLADEPLRSRMDIKVFVDAENDVRLIRRIRRDVVERARSLESVLDQYERCVRPMHLEFVEPQKRFADLILSEGGHNRAAIDTLCARISSVLADRRPSRKEEG